MKFNILTIFPNLFRGFLNESLLARAQKKRLITIKTHNLRKWTTDKHKTVDDRPYGGGAGMVLKVEPIYKAVRAISGKQYAVSQKNKKPTAYSLKPKAWVILLSAKGETFTQKDARRLAKYDQLIFICGRYEGVDERVAKYVADEEISIGSYVLFGGEVASMVIIEAVSRLIPGVIANTEFLREESFSFQREADSRKQRAMVREYPQYTRPEVFIPNSKLKILKSKSWKVPKVLLSGNHRKIKEWRAGRTS